ncbi:hypothetical protein GOP47_0020865 [Adiantum capillus-veneris]|uniref:glutamate--tRNA ligase n=1 Tax=Adiantum capillus-veneris TaxID=13818 RepID=A0A9D4Z7V8_ADICA|nr:hypothetical protein GOP47_0020865 [Adiantum capillus-veneris]
MFRSQGGKFILRIEDTDLERSTRESEEAVLRDLTWLGLEWDEGPNKDGGVGPYRQSERTSLYLKYAEQLVESGHAYKCFCTDEELEAMREEAKAKNLPPKYSGKWAKANKDEVEAELAKGKPYTYRFRVADEGSVKINDLIRGEVVWALDTLGDFIILRSNGQPVYNFCVAVDDATMQISHVIRAEEHLPNTLRQALIYQALGFPMPKFGHVSLILAPDRSKLSKRHGATSVGQFKEMGFLSQGMVNYLALLGWNDGTEDEIFALDQLIEKFSIERVTKSAAIFDNTKLRWINGQHLRSLPEKALTQMCGEFWEKASLLTVHEGPFVEDAVRVLKGGLEVVSDAGKGLSDLLSYPLEESLCSPEVKEIVDDNLREVADAILTAYDSGDLQNAIKSGHDEWQKWVKSAGKSMKRKGKRLFMPIRLLITGKRAGPDIGSAVELLYKAETSGVVHAQAGLVTIAERMKRLKEVEWDSVSEKLASTVKAPESATVLAH